MYYQRIRHKHSEGIRCINEHNIKNDLLYVLISHKRVTNMNQPDRDEPKHRETQPLTKSNSIFFFVIVYPHPNGIWNYRSYHDDHDYANKGIIHRCPDQLPKSTDKGEPGYGLEGRLEFSSRISWHLVHGKFIQGGSKLKWVNIWKWVLVKSSNRKHGVNIIRASKFSYIESFWWPVSEV